VVETASIDALCSLPVLGARASADGGRHLREVRAKPVQRGLERFHPRLEAVLETVDSVLETSKRMDPAGERYDPAGSSPPVRR
jgi:hypothetical protein